MEKLKRGQRGGQEGHGEGGQGEGEVLRKIGRLERMMQEIRGCNRGGLTVKGGVGKGFVRSSAHEET